MHKIVIFISILLFSLSAFAFGGGGGGGGRSANRTNERYKSGVDSLGIHVDGKGNKPDITFTCDDPNATPDSYGVCSCNEGYKKENDTCVQDACQGFTPNGCITDCTSSNGQASYTECNNSGICISNQCQYDPIIPDPIECNPSCGECLTCDTSNGTCVIDENQEDQPCTNGACKAGACTNLCQGITPDVCMKCNPQTGNQEIDTTQDTQPCEIGSICDAGFCVCDFSQHLEGSAGACTCQQGYYGSASTQCNECPTNASCPGGETFSCQNGYESNGSACVCNTQKFINAQGACDTCPTQATCDGTANFTCGDWAKQGDTCVDPCLGQTPTGCIKTLKAAAGSCVPDQYYTASEHYVCAENKECNDQQQCVCVGYMKNTVCTACPEKAQCDGTNFTCNASYYKDGDGCTLCDTTKGEFMDNGTCKCDNNNNYYGTPGSCSLCNATGKILNGNTCVCDQTHHFVGDDVCSCDTANGWNPDPDGLCIQCTQTGTVYDPGTKTCICDESAHWVSDGINSCQCATNYQPKQENATTTCVLDPCIAIRTQHAKCLNQCESEAGVVTTENYNTLCSSTNDPTENDNWICNTETHACEDPCTIGEHNIDECTLNWNASHGVCVPEYASTTTSCTINGKSGFLCDGEGHCRCPEGSYITDTDGTCAACPISDADHLSSSNGLSNTECNQCADAWYQDGTCYSSCPNPDTYWRTSDTGASCVSCDNKKTASTPISVESCAKCAGLRYIEPNKSGGPKCWSCNQSKTTSTYAFTGSNGFRGGYEARLQEFIDLCNACPNRFYNEETHKCECLNVAGSTCCEIGKVAMDGQCVSASLTCTSGTTFYSYDTHSCLPCGTEGHKADRTTCDACGMVYLTSDSTCHNKPPLGQLMDNNGNVFDCTSTVTVLGVTSQSMCQESCSNRFYSDRTSRTDCIRCDAADAYPSTASECSKCASNRTFNADTGLCSCAVTKKTVTRMVSDWDPETHTFLPPAEKKVSICPRPEDEE